MKGLKSLKCLVIMLAMATLAGKSTGHGRGRFKDPRDGKIYPTVQIGSQIWLAKNLDFKTPNSWCYEDDFEYCKDYGRLYTWNDAMIACPKGWHLPSDSEWTQLDQAIHSNASTLCSKEWDGPDTYGFSAIPAGVRYCSIREHELHQGVEFRKKDVLVELWSSYQDSGKKRKAVSRTFGCTYHELVRSHLSTNYGLSVRCVRD